MDRNLIPTRSGELWMGGAPDYDTDAELLDFDLNVNCTFDQPWPERFGAGLYVRHVLADNDYDMADHDTAERTRAIASFIAGALTMGWRVHVHCTMGLNRSGVVAARALMYMGMSSTGAIALLREHRVLSPRRSFGLHPLFNRAYERWLLAEDGAMSTPTQQELEDVFAAEVADRDRFGHDAACAARASRGRELCDCAT